VVGAPEARVVLLVFLQTVRVSRAGQVQVLPGVRAGHGYVYCQALGVPPARDGHVTRSPPRGLSKDEPLLQHRRQQTLLGDAKEKVAKAVVTHDDV